MSMRRVAQLAGVSTATVSRVFHENPCVSAETAAAVRQAVERIGFTPAPRKRRYGANGNGTNDAVAKGAIAFLVLGTAGSSATPAFEKLLRGVTEAVNASDLSFVLSFVSNPAEIPSRVRDRQLVGVLCHGDQPTDAALGWLQVLPTVWLMANRHRPRWGDQVMPNNAVIGDTAGRYLVRRGHRRLAYLGLAREGWCMGLRSFAFRKAAEDAGAAADVFEAPAAVEDGRDYWHGDGELTSAAPDRLVGQIVAASPMPTGLFVAEDRLLPMVDRALRSRDVRPGSDVEIIACNNEQPHYARLASQPARIDIRTEAIGRRGVEQLIWRIASGGDAAERIRVMVDPVLIEPNDAENGVTSHVPGESADRPSAEVEVEVPITSH